MQLKICIAGFGNLIVKINLILGFAKVYSGNSELSLVYGVIYFKKRKQLADRQIKLIIFIIGGNIITDNPLILKGKIDFGTVTIPVLLSRSY